MRVSVNSQLNRATLEGPAALVSHVRNAINEQLLIINKVEKQITVQFLRLLENELIRKRLTSQLQDESAKFFWHVEDANALKEPTGKVKVTFFSPDETQMQKAMCIL